MISLKKKKCNICGDMSYLFSKGACKPCYTKYVLAPKTKNKKKPINILNRFSKTQQERTKKYSKLREDYLKSHHLCEVCSLHSANQIHHKRGRVGENLFKYFLAVCDDCHRLIENNPIWAKDQGYSESRLYNDGEQYNNDS